MQPIIDTALRYIQMIIVFSGFCYMLYGLVQYGASKSSHNPGDGRQGLVGTFGGILVIAVGYGVPELLKQALPMLGSR